MAQQSQTTGEEVFIEWAIVISTDCPRTSMLQNDSDATLSPWISPLLSFSFQSAYWTSINFIETSFNCERQIHNHAMCQTLVIEMQHITTMSIGLQHLSRSLTWSKIQRTDLCDLQRDTMSSLPTANAPNDKQHCISLAVMQPEKHPPSEIFLGSFWPSMMRVLANTWAVHSCVLTWNHYVLWVTAAGTHFHCCVCVRTDVFRMLYGQ